MTSEKVNDLAGELNSIKMLLILQSLASGCQQKHVAAVLGVSEATLSRMLPKGLGKEISGLARRQRGAVLEGE